MAIECPTPYKKRHPSRLYAERNIQHAWRTGRAKHLPIRAYHCPCGFWHTTSKPLRKVA